MDFGLLCAFFVFELTLNFSEKMKFCTVKLRWKCFSLGYCRFIELGVAQWQRGARVPVGRTVLHFLPMNAARAYFAYFWFSVPGG
ncbi:hypothetical protein [Pantoea sp. 18069]|uniref:hypothetical protein n=1 Tax=Pantoea sp. 18069 TaxID=2681415 RepID=UPI001359950A|nr:hypothetical protein [Pantoea sp. 18069]